MSGQVFIYEHPLFPMVTIKVDSSNCLEIEQEVFRLIDSGVFQAFKSINLSYSTNYVPEIIFECDWIESLEINNDYPLVMTSEFNKLENLNEIFVYGVLAQIYDDISLPKLQSFKASNTLLSSFPDSILDWVSLTHLTLEGGTISTIPPLRSSLNHLKDLNLSGNHITHIPPTISSLKSLVYLGLGDNQIKFLPIEICELESIVSINLVGNNKLKVAKEIFDCLDEKLVLDE